MQELENELKKFRFCQKIDMRWSDIDEMGHVNNAIYLTYFEQARVYYFHESCQWDWKEDGVILASAHVDYIMPLRFPSPAFIYVRCVRIGNKSFELHYAIVEHLDDGKRLMAKGSTVLVMFDYKTNQSISMPEHLRKKITDFEPSIAS